jgi:effector-binding domain-containing protein
VDKLITTLEEPTVSIEITHRTLPARTVASIRGTIPTYADEGLLWQRLMSGLPAAGAIPTQAPLAVAVFHDDEYMEADADVEVQLDVAAAFVSTDAVACVEVLELTIAVGTLHGRYDGIGAVMEAIGRWVPEHGYRFVGPMFDNYLVGPAQESDPTHWVTEVCMPVALVSAG